MNTLTVFTPTYNRKHTLSRTFESLCRQTHRDFEWLIIDDGSTDGTAEWVKSLGEKILEREQRYDWMGRLTEGANGDNFAILVRQQEDVSPLLIHYIYKENGGLYTGYNVAYSHIETELCVCIDSDDYMPDDAVEKIIKYWNGRPAEKDFCGVVGLDFNVVDGKPIGGRFPDGLLEAYQIEIPHRGDTKQVMRTDLMRQVAPQIGFKGEKDFNPFYMLMQILDKYPILIANENFCWVEYQVGVDSMSQGIWKQYIRSPYSYIKYRLLEMQLTHSHSFMNKLRVCTHYVSSCLIAKDVNWFRQTPFKTLTLLVSPIGFMWFLLIKYKNRG